MSTLFITWPTNICFSLHLDI